MVTTVLHYSERGKQSRAQPIHGEAVMVIDEEGTICGCDDAAQVLFKYCRHELVGQHVSLVLPELSEGELMRDGKPIPRLRLLCSIGHEFRVLTRDGQWLRGEVFLNCLPDPGAIGIRVVAQVL